MRPRLLIALYLAVILLPLALSALSARPARSIADELASGAGMLAFAIILVEFTLSGRYRIVSKRVGMDITMRIHQLIARTALVAVLLHPFLYRAEWNPPYPWDVTRALTVTSDFSALWSGIAAWLLLPSLVALALTRGMPNYSYEAWRWMHGIGALIIAGLSLHHVLIAGRYAEDPLIAGYWVALSVVAAVSFLWVYIAVPAMQLRRPWRVERVAHVADRIWEVEVAPEGHGGLSYEAGQFAWLNIGHSPFALSENPFSISSAPASGPNLQFLIKELGDFTSGVGKIATGTRAYVDGPHGTLKVTGRREGGIALIGGGIGVAPLLGILRQLDAEGDPRPRVMIYADRRADQIAHRSELEMLASAHNTELRLVLQEPPDCWTGGTGLIDATLLGGVLGADARDGWIFVLCGPPRMLDSVESTLIDMGVPADRILSERFDYE